MFKSTFDNKFFLKNIWQKKPQIFRNFFTDFVDPISPEELAGLAIEEEVSSRIVITNDNDWEIIHGPFEDYQKFGDSRWQLLVQAANHWHMGAASFTEAFRFLPDWRFDDLMVSFATKNGGVGPHIDNYDVFIVQGSGRRHWKVGDKGTYKNRNNDPQSSLIEDFTPIIDETLEPGDMLYIPPGFPHSGSTLTDSMSYSLGYRAPSQQEMFSELADYLMDNDLGKTRFESKDASSGKGIISTSEQSGLLKLITEFSQSPQLYQTSIGLLLSRNRFELDICPDEDFNIDDLCSAIESGDTLTRINGLKIIHLESDLEQRIFIDGEQYALATCNHSDIEYISNNYIYDNEWLRSVATNKEVISFLNQMVQKGFLYHDE